MPKATYLIPTPSVLARGNYAYAYGGGMPGPYVDLDMARENRAKAQALLDDAIALVRWALGAARLERTNPKGLTKDQSHRIHAHHMQHVLHQQARIVRLVRERGVWDRAIKDLDYKTPLADWAKPIMGPVNAGMSSAAIAKLFSSGNVFGLGRAR